ncbi:MAG: hypothetical protein AB7P04_03930 [Bacteriovoracia bacterium]
MSNQKVYSETPLAVVADVSRIATRVVDRITGDRADFPLLVALAAARRLAKYDIRADVMYGRAAWVEVLENSTPVWTGAWKDHSHFWVATQFGETVDLTAAVSYKKRGGNPDIHPQYSPPLLWSKDYPRFYRYFPEGIAELETPSDPKFARWVELVLSEMDRHPLTDVNATENLDFPDEPLLCNGRRLLDDGAETFKNFDRVLGVRGIPESPI